MNNLYRSNYKKYNNLSRSNLPIDGNKNEHKKLCFKTIKCNTISSLNEVECFLNNMNKFWNYVKLYKLLR